MDEAFFGVFGIRLLSGRGFEAGDFTSFSSAVIVSEDLAERVSGTVLGRRLRYVNDAEGGGSPGPGRWYEIVGVVDNDAASLRLYHPGLPGLVDPAYLALDSGPDTALSAAQIRELAKSVDPTLRVDEFAWLGSLMRRANTAQYFTAASIAAMTLSVLFLSASGIHALMSVILSQRRREIGIRLALGAPPYQLTKEIFRRAASGLTAGAAGGVLLALLIRHIAPRALVEFRMTGAIPATAGVMILVGLIASVGPVRRAARVDPNETLRDA